MSSELTTQAKYWFIVPATGIGSRMNKDKPKQYLALQGKAVIEHTLDRLLSFPSLAGIVVCINENDLYWKTLALSNHEKITAVTGGKERMHSVYEALNFLANKTDFNEQSFVLVHDAVRPCVSHADIEKLVSELKGDEVGGLLASPSVDTLKRTDQHNRVVETLPREQCWRAQTPQMFRFNLLKKSIEAQLNRNEFVSDESAAIEAMGFQAKIVEGAADNLKITFPSDVDILSSILQKQQVNAKTSAAGLQHD